MTTCCKDAAMGYDCQCNKGADMTAHDDMSPEVAARIRELEAENARLKNALIATRNDLHEINAGDLSTFEVQDAISAALEEKNDE